MACGVCEDRHGASEEIRHPDLLAAVSVVVCKRSTILGEGSLHQCSTGKRIVEARQLWHPNTHVPHGGDSGEFKLSEENPRRTWRRTGSMRGWSAGMEIDIEAASSTD